MEQFQGKNTLYSESFEHDACGIGAVIDIGGKQSHQVVDDALSIVEKLEHRAGKDASGEIGDGVGIMVQISHKFFKKEAKAPVLRESAVFWNRKGNISSYEIRMTGTLISMLSKICIRR